MRLTELDGRGGSTCQHTEECHEKGRGREDYCGIREGDEGGEEVGEVGREKLRRCRRRRRRVIRWARVWS